MEFRKGELVKFKEPVSAEEDALVMVVLEDRDTRVLVTTLDLKQERPLQPTFVYAKDDLTYAAPAVQNR